MADGVRDVWAWLSVVVFALFMALIVLYMLALGLREVGVGVPCLLVPDPLDAARERVERDIAGRGGRDAVALIEEDEEAEDVAFIIETERRAVYWVSEQLLAGPAVCAGMVIDAVDRPR